MTEQTNTNFSGRRFFALLAALLLPGFGLVYGTMQEAITQALEAASPYVKEGFKIREDNWHGETKSGKPLLVKHQLFRGNEYWFWAATSFPGSTAGFYRKRAGPILSGSRFPPLNTMNSTGAWSMDIDKQAG
jgi:hypothetical protein